MDNEDFQLGFSLTAKQREAMVAEQNRRMLRDSLDSVMFGMRKPHLEIAPHDRGQLQALSADAKIRILIPGNGFGKTTCMAIDVAMLMDGYDILKPHVVPTKWPPTAIWFCQKYGQWEIMKPDVEAILPGGWKWKSQKNYYEWPNGSRLFILSSDSDWTAIQGVEIDMVYFDEHPDRAFWVEMQFRRRGKKKTRYMVAATMTQGITWFIRQVVQPWEKSFTDRGLTLDQAHEINDDPDVWVWMKGGVEDNPTATEDDVEHYKNVQGASEKELQVRSKGGYADFSGEGVFDMAGCEYQEQFTEPGQSGSLVWLPDADPDAVRRVLMDRYLLETTKGDYAHRFGGVKDRDLWCWVPDAPVDGGRITIFRDPDPNEAGNYVMGADFAYGLKDKDYDACTVLLRRPDGVYEQVAEAVGRWGDVFFAETLYALGCWYYEAFLVGERQVGLPAMRRLFDEMGYTHQFRRRDDAKTGRRASDDLGHHRSAGDTIVSNARLAVFRKDVIIHSSELLTQVKRYQFRSKNKTETIDDVSQSDKLTTGAPDGEHDDMVMGFCYSIHGCREAVHYVKPDDDYKRGTFGEVMGLKEDMKPERRKKKDPYAL